MSTLFGFIFFFSFLASIGIAIYWFIARSKHKSFPMFKKAIIGSLVVLTVSLMGGVATANNATKDSKPTSSASKKSESSKKSASESSEKASIANSKAISSSEAAASSKAKQASIESSEKASSESSKKLVWTLLKNQVRKLSECHRLLRYPKRNHYRIQKKHQMKMLLQLPLLKITQQTQQTQHKYTQALVNKLSVMQSLNFIMFLVKRDTI